MMNVWIMRVSMKQLFMGMHVHVGFSQEGWVVMMPMVLIMAVPVIMLNWLMPVPMFVSFS